MAPSATYIEDDFITTLSDNDDISDEEFASPNPPSKSLNNDGRNKTTKRKREDIANGAEEEPEEVKSKVKNKKRKVETNGAENGVEGDAGQADGEIESDFEFDNSDQRLGMGDFDGWVLQGDDAAGEGGATGGMVDIDEMVERRRKKKLSSTQDNEESSDGDDEVDEDEDEDQAEEFHSFEDDELDEDEDDADIALNGDDDSEVDPVEDDEDQDEDTAHPMPHPEDVDGDSQSDVEKEDAEEEAKSKAFFAAETLDTPAVVGEAFTSMSLSRPILKGLSSVGFTKPTPIQAKTIPVALEGKDIVGGAVTGSGKTAAFMIPILERLLYRPKRMATTRVAVLMPTRELALQCLSVAKKLAAFTDITFGRAIGGLNSREQEKELKLRPDIVIATPGRFIDFMRNSNAFEVDKIEILVLDEADRMLEEGFADELNEILTTIPKSRQTMLFSATMTSRIDDLVRAGLQRPVRLLVDAQKATTTGLTQEFVRLRPGREQKRLGYLLYLCTTTHTDRAIIFFRQKKEAHRVRIIFALCGLRAAELHGSMTQEQRISAIEAFRSGKASFLLATDLASRGLDIKGIDAVINYEAPQSHEIYLHRVGRTARAGRKGVSCTLAAEPDRKVVKAAVKAGKSQGAGIRQRTIDPKDADAWQKKCDALEEEVEEILREEKEEKALQQTERTIQKAENVVKYEDEIKSRPKKTWFQTEREKLLAKDKGSVVLNGPGEEAGEKRKKGGKLSNKKKKQLEDKEDRRDGKIWKKGKDMRGLGGREMKQKLGESEKKRKGGKKAKGKGKK